MQRFHYKLFDAPVPWVRPPRKEVLVLLDGTWDGWRRCAEAFVQAATLFAGGDIKWRGECSPLELARRGRRQADPRVVLDALAGGALATRKLREIRDELRALRTSKGGSA